MNAKGRSANETGVPFGRLSTMAAMHTIKEVKGAIRSALHFATDLHQSICQHAQRWWPIHVLDIGAVLLHQLRRVLGQSPMDTRAEAAIVPAAEGTLQCSEWSIDQRSTSATNGCTELTERNVDYITVASNERIHSGSISV